MHRLKAPDMLRRLQEINALAQKDRDCILCNLDVLLRRAVIYQTLISCIFAVIFLYIMLDFIEEIWNDRARLSEAAAQDVIQNVIASLDKGQLRVAEPLSDGTWKVNDWIKKAVILYFPIRQMETMEAGPLEFHDKMPLKRNYKELGVRVVPHAVARYGSFLASGTILMPSYVNIGAYVDSGTMVDTWATVGSCAQIGKNVHLSGGVGIGGVLEPVQAAPVIIEDGCFVGSRCIIVEGVRVGREAVLGANVVLTASTKIIDVTGNQPVEFKGHVPDRSVVIPGSYTKRFPAGDYQVPCALIIGQRKASTDLKTSLNDALRDYNVAV
jgi:2,3,4,5-tetrahydropyridine-2-carboxylate N-succinyltransferase